MQISLANARVDGGRLWDSLMAMAEIGPGVAGGNNRQALTTADGEGRALLARWCRDAGLSAGSDAMGNQFFVRPGSDPALAPVAIGSHLDTQPTGGRFDGVLGVLAALEVIRTLDDLGLHTRHPLMLVNWANEEGTRFSPALLASGVFAGVYELDWALDRRDADGVRYGDALTAIDAAGPETVGARVLHALLELHIEQGPVLESEDLEIGVVTGAQGLRWVELSFEGRESHTGTTPMPLRRNAGLALARATLLADRIATERGDDAVGAMGRALQWPNSPNVVPGRAVGVADFRHPEPGVAEAMAGELEAGAAAIADELGVTLSTRRVGEYEPVVFDPDCVSAVRAAAQSLGLRHRNMISGAGHDACFVSRVAPTAMIFCPCEGGLSHNEAEAITPDWARAGADVLLHAALTLAGVVD